MKIITTPVHRKNCLAEVYFKIPSLETLSVHTAKKVLSGFGISITFKNVFKLKKVNSDAFCNKIKLKISRVVHEQ